MQKRGERVKKEGKRWIFLWARIYNLLFWFALGKKPIVLMVNNNNSNTCSRYLLKHPVLSSFLELQLNNLIRGYFIG